MQFLGVFEDIMEWARIVNRSNMRADVALEENQSNYQYAALQAEERWRCLKFKACSIALLLSSCSCVCLHPKRLVFPCSFGAVLHQHVLPFCIAPGICGSNDVI